MKSIYLFLCVWIIHIGMAQEINYEKKWQEIDKEMNNGEFKSLLPQINQLYNQAKKENNTLEIINALIYQYRIISQTKEDKDYDPYKLVIHNFEKEMNSFKGITLSITKSMLAKIYEDYLFRTSWERRNIINTEFLSNDISNWSTKQLMQRSLSLYKESVENDHLLKKETTLNWKNILNTDENIDLYPTLYDILVSRYIEALKEIFSQIEFNSWSDMEENKEVIGIKIKEEIDNLYNGLLEFHKNDVDKSAFLNNKLNQIEETNRSLEKTENKAHLIENLANSYSDQKFTAYLYYRAAATYVNTNKEKAFKICKNVTYTQNNPWSINCKNLIDEIQKINIHASLDEILLPNENIPLIIEATNVNKAYYRIYQVNPDIDSINTSSNTEFKTNGIYSLNKKLVKNGILEWKSFSDFDSHSTLVKLDGLPEGNYILELSTNSEFLTKKEINSDINGSLYFMVHDWSIVKLGRYVDPLFQLLNRKTGEVFSNRSITLYKKQKSKNNSKILFESFSINTDSHGFFDLSKLNAQYGEIYVYVPSSHSYMKLPSNFYNNEVEEVKNDLEKISEFFTDRSMYRPGQKVFFKVIIYTKNKNKTLLVKNQKVILSLNNANGKEISKLELISNEYGSVFGEFILPQEGLTGNYYLTSNFSNDAYYFSVEEYKRPKFEIIFDEFSGNYKLDEQVTSKGKAISYNGTPVSNAKVQYRIERKDLFPLYRLYNPIPYLDNSEIITQGELTTDKEGVFTISYPAIAKDIKKDNEYRYYTYIISVDVTDINGETQTKKTKVTIGDLPIQLTLQLPEVSTQKDFTKIIIQSTNLNEVRVFSQGIVNLSKLINPSRVLLPNKVVYIPEYQLYDNVSFERYFPHLPYSKEEQNPASWKKEKLYTYNFDTKTSDTLVVSSQLPKGFYLVEAETLLGKDTIKTQKIIEIKDNESLKSSDSEYFSVNTSQSSYKIGERITINFYSDLKNSTAILHLESNGKWILHKEIPIVKGKGTYTLIAKKDFITKGLYVLSYLIKDGGFQAKSFQIDIMDEPRDLKITTKVFRNKLIPGEKESWELTVSGKDKDKIAAEVLATLYDESLDQFAPNAYTFTPWKYFPSGILYYSVFEMGYNSSSTRLSENIPYLIYKNPKIVNLKDITINKIYDRDGVAASAFAIPIRAEYMLSNSILDNNLNKMRTGGKVSKQEVIKDNSLSMVKFRTNLKETAFFYPNLYTDEQGNFTFSFTCPEALTKWKLLILAHTKDLYSGTAEFHVQTQKNLMIVPNTPRFLREGDEIIISAKINNLTGKSMEGNAQLFLFDALTRKPVDTNFNNLSPIIPFKAELSKNAEVSWKIKVPKNIQAVSYRIVAQAGNFSDGEENSLPIVTDRVLITETVPINIKENEKKEYRLDKLITNSSSSLLNYNLSLEVATNPVWLALFSIPYLREYHYENSEQVFSRLFGNVLSTFILNTFPKIKNVLNDWNVKGVNPSNLESNQEFKNILIEETPWIRNAENEAEQKKRISLLFDLNKMAQENSQVQEKLIKLQNTDGGFAWFEGGNSNPYITDIIISGIGQLRKMLGTQYSIYIQSDLENVIKKAVAYSDREALHYLNQKEFEKIGKEGDLIQYYYIRSFWKDRYPLPMQTEKHIQDINKNITKYLKKSGTQIKAMLAIIMQRFGYASTARTIILHLKETSVESESMGMYWKDNQAGWDRYQTPIEAQTKIIEAFAEVTPEDTRSVEEMKIWLLGNRQTHSWSSTKATTHAIYALMNFGKDWSDEKNNIKIFNGKKQIYPTSDSTMIQTTGYLKKSWNSEQIQSDMGIIKIEKTSPGIAWGGLYWQYFENLNKITNTGNEIKIQKKLFIKTVSNKSFELQEITNQNYIKIGDIITIRLVIKADRDMDFIYVKDMRASGFEPMNIFTAYQYQNGLSYYESTRDAATNFFFEHMRKGTYVFEYEVRAAYEGNFSSGITLVQSMYAPEMSAYSGENHIIIKKYK
ncbi:Uncharacterized conserved protein YfaS, alpha-2-macroglobulin family [Apibacter mensalis]|uniref:Uncharacterized conserved protein YfaS, alpha-2-macroglobulin family n=1 Tax=Apibacter mensalis TaxID=1586267 RepID=A0A0X3AQM8_9FLAO|nr:alpha-2-macroglobulin family protein [Apibacter mensalis]CVK16666.1 Uncharacterized conserved protein YfaS, alpha-2-macroglobulin family [Apibacter mensalis]